MYTVIFGRGRKKEKRQGKRYNCPPSPLIFAFSPSPSLSILPPSLHSAVMIRPLLSESFHASRILAFFSRHTHTQTNMHAHTLGFTLIHTHTHTQTRTLHTRVSTRTHTSLCAFSSAQTHTHTHTLHWVPTLTHKQHTHTNKQTNTQAEYCTHTHTHLLWGDKSWSCSWRLHPLWPFTHPGALSH